MIGTLQALLVAVLAVLPGALYTVARETHGASWAWRQTDGATLVMRFLSFSAVFHALLAPLTYYAYRRLVVNPVVVHGWAISWHWYALLLSYMALPYAFGVITQKGRRIRGVRRVVAMWGGSSPELRAWDRFFSDRPVGVMRLKLASNEWKAGLFDERSYASSYGEEGDIYLAEQYLVGDDGLPIFTNGNYSPAGAGLLIRWPEIRYVDFTPWVETEPDPPTEP